MESENNPSSNNINEPKNKEVKIRHPLEKDNEEVNNSRNIELSKENENKVNIYNESEKRDQINPSSGNLF